MKNNSLLRTDKKLAELYQRHAERVYRLSYIYLKVINDKEIASIVFFDQEIPIEN